FQEWIQVYTKQSLKETLKCLSKRGNLTPKPLQKKNTVLHIAAELGKIQRVEVILKACPSLLKHENLKGETALHVAAREGHNDVVKALVAAAKVLNEELEIEAGTVRDLLRVTNNKKNTALHEAVRNRHLEVVRCLLEEDSEFPYVGNNAGETPLGYRELVHAILEACKSPAHDGPKGRTALHGAVWHNDKDMIKDILRKKPLLVKEADEHGWTSLHWAAYFDRRLIIIQLLEYDESVAYLKDKEGMTALHVAATWGSWHSLKKIIAKCPDCIEMVDEKRRNALHVAVVKGQNSVVSDILQNPLIGSLINEEDVSGNTPLHLLAASANYNPELVTHPKVDMEAVNNAHLTALDIQISSEAKDKEESLKRVGDTHLIVAALIATVTFAAGFTVPGGYDGNEGPNQGMAILSNKTAFQAFVVSDTIAMALSTSAVFMHFIMTMPYEWEKLAKVWWFVTSAALLLMLASAAMVIAFMTGMYAVLGHSLALAIATLVIASSFFILQAASFYSSLYC
ncbi:Ankyrin repeat, partial [Dillenia turbinata]